MEPFERIVDLPGDDNVVRLDPAGGNAQPKPPLIQTSAQFARDFTPPEYLLDGVLQLRYCYSFTAETGTGKTAVMLRLAAHVALGRPIGARFVDQGRVLYFAGENPEDIRARWIALAQEMAFDLDEIDVCFIPGTFKISEMRPRIADEMARMGEFSLILIDTSAAYYEGDDENNNTQMGRHARQLRSLCQMAGGPCVLVACHPVKRAADDNLLPRGGGAFLAEVDGNLTARKVDSAVAVHWQGKFRGPEFTEILFGLRTVTCQRLKDSRDRLIPTVISYPMSDDAREEIAAAARTEENRLLLRLVEAPAASQAEHARALGWNLQSGDPNKMKVNRTIDKLEKAKLVKRDRDGVSLTPTGEKLREKLKPTKVAEID